MKQMLEDNLSIVCVGKSKYNRIVHQNSCSISIREMLVFHLYVSIQVPFISL